MRKNLAPILLMRKLKSSSLPLSSQGRSRGEGCCFTLGSVAVGFHSQQKYKQTLNEYRLNERKFGTEY